MMPPLDTVFKVGDRVVVYSGPTPIQARVVELRGPLGPKGIQIYGITVPGSFKRHYLEVREDQLEPAATAKAG